MSAIMSDVIEHKLTPGVANAAVNAGGKLLKIVDMQLRHGTSVGGGASQTLQLVAE